MDWITFSKREIESDALPQICVECGEPASCRVSKTFDHAPEWAALLLLVGIFPGVIALALLQREMRVSCPLCETHRRKWQTTPFSLRFGWPVIPVGAGLGWVGSLFSNSPEARVAGPLIGAGIFAAAWGIWVGVDSAARSHVKAKRVTSDEISLEGLAAEFVKAARERQQIMSARPGP